jgi:hypothetical protein
MRPDNCLIASQDQDLCELNCTRAAWRVSAYSGSTLGACFFSESCSAIACLQRSSNQNLYNKHTCLNLIAALSPAGPAPTISRSNFICSLGCCSCCTAAELLRDRSTAAMHGCHCAKLLLQLLLAAAAALSSSIADLRSCLRLQDDR